MDNVNCKMKLGLDDGSKRCDQIVLRPFIIKSDEMT